MIPCDVKANTGPGYWGWEVSNGFLTGLNPQLVLKLFSASIALCCHLFLPRRDTRKVTHIRCPWWREGPCLGKRKFLCKEAVASLFNTNKLGGLFSSSETVPSNIRLSCSFLIGLIGKRQLRCPALNMLCSGSNEARRLSAVSWPEPGIFFVDSCKRTESQ